MLFYDYYHREDPQKLRQIRMGKINFEEKNNRKTRREYKTDEEKQTLAQLHLQDGDTLGIDDRTSSVSNWKDASSTHLSLRKNQYSLTIKNSLEPNATKPMTCSCSNDTVSLMKTNRKGIFTFITVDWRRETKGDTSI